ncbi:unnamed protein product, partial [Didymodactylos carnosus]
VNSVSQREIQRVFQLIDFFWALRYDDEIKDEHNDSNDSVNLYERNPVICIALSIALIYYFRLATTNDRKQYDDVESPTREEFSRILSRTIPDFDRVVQIELEKFVTHDNFLIPSGVALNQA